MISLERNGRNTLIGCSGIAAFALLWGVWEAGWWIAGMIGGLG